MLFRVGLAIVLLAVPAFVWGLYPGGWLRLGGFALPDGALTLEQLLGPRRGVRSGSAWSCRRWAGLRWASGRTLILGQMRGWQQIIGAVVSLEWLYRAIGCRLRLAGSGLQYFARLGEGEGYLGWLALAGLVLWVLLRGIAIESLADLFRQLSILVGLPAVLLAGGGRGHHRHHARLADRARSPTQSSR